jgi:hypothetical protein
MENNYDFVSHGQGRSQSQVGHQTLGDHLVRIEAQIESDCFEKEYKAQVEEICLIIAEVFMLPKTAEIQIAGQKITVAMVCEIYDMLEWRDIVAVMDNTEKATYEIKHKKTYLRTALYNSVFERETREVNKMRVDDGGNYIGTRRERIDEQKRKASHEWLDRQRHKSGGQA